MRKKLKNRLIHIFLSSLHLLFFVIPAGVVLGFYSAQTYSVAQNPLEEARKSFLQKKEQKLDARTSNWILSQNAHFEKVQEQKDNERISDILSNDKEYLKQVGSRSYRNNNPGNLRYVGQAGSIGADENGYAVFPTYEAGKLAHLRQIEVDANRGHTIETFLKKFAPRAENFPNHYLSYLLKKFPDATPETPLASLDFEAVQKQMQQVEGWIEPKIKKAEIISTPKEATISSLDPRKTELKLKVSGCNTVQDVKARIQCLREKK